MISFTDVFDKNQPLYLKRGIIASLSTIILSLTLVILLLLDYDPNSFEDLASATLTLLAIEFGNEEKRSVYDPSRSPPDMRMVLLIIFCWILLFRGLFVSIVLPLIGSLMGNTLKGLGSQKVEDLNDGYWRIIDHLWAFLVIFASLSCSWVYLIKGSNEAEPFFVNNGGSTIIGASAGTMAATITGIWFGYRDMCQFHLRKD